MLNSALTLYVFILVSFLTACQTPPKLRPASEYLFSTDKAQTQFLEELKIKLVENKYIIKTIDFETGFLVTQPRKFKLQNASGSINARQILQIRQEGGGVKVRVVYDCQTNDGGQVNFSPCLSEDAVANERINRLERPLVGIIEESLYKHKQE